MLFKYIEIMFVYFKLLFMLQNITRRGVLHLRTFNIIFLHFRSGLRAMLMDNTNLSVNQYRPSIYP